VRLSPRASVRSRVKRAGNDDEALPDTSGYSSHRREVGMYKVANANAEAGHGTSETRSSPGTGRDAMGFGHTIFVAGSARREVWVLANGVRTLPRMARRGPLAADNRSAQALSMMRATPSRDRSVTVGLACADLCRGWGTAKATILHSPSMLLSKHTSSVKKSPVLATAVSGWGGQTASGLPTCARGRCAFCA